MGKPIMLRTVFIAALVSRRDDRSSLRSGRVPMSNKPVAERLQVKGGRRLAVLGASQELDRHYALSRSA